MERLLLVVLLAGVLALSNTVLYAEPQTRIAHTTIFYNGLLEVATSGEYTPRNFVNSGASSFYMRVTYLVRADIEIAVVNGVTMYSANISRWIDSISSAPLNVVNSTSLQAESNLSYASIGIFNPPIVLSFNESLGWDVLDWSGFKENIVLFDVDLVHKGVKQVESYEKTNVMLIKDLYYEPVTMIPVFYAYTYSVQSPNGGLMVRVSLNGLFSTLNLTSIVRREVISIGVGNDTSVVIRVDRLVHDRLSVEQVNDTSIRLVFNGLAPVFIQVEIPPNVELKSNVGFTKLSSGPTAYYVYEGVVSGDVLLDFGERVSLLSGNQTSLTGGVGLPMSTNVGDLVFTALVVSLSVYAAYLLADKISRSL